MKNKKINKIINFELNRFLRFDEKTEKVIEALDLPMLFKISIKSNFIADLRQKSRIILFSLRFGPKCLLKVMFC